MFEQRNLKLDLLALGLLATVIFLAAALFSYDPADPPNQLVFPQHAHAANMCGHWGAVASRLLLEGLGLGAYYLLVSLAALDVVLLTRREVSQPWLRAGGWLLSLSGVATLAALAVPGLSPGPVIGAGGYLGATGKGLLQTQFASVGTYILTVSMILGGLLLCDRLCAAAAVGVGRGQAHPQLGPRRVASRRGLCPKAQPVAIRSR